MKSPISQTPPTKNGTLYFFGLLVEIPYIHRLLTH
jgi:hypothetical protein